MPAAYLTPPEANTRLASYGLDATPSAAVLSLASDQLDTKGGFVGQKVEPSQLREFPRAPQVRDDVAGQTPSRVLDWVALRAYQLGKEDDAPVLQESVGDLSVRYARGKRSRVSRLMKDLLRDYQARSFRIT